MEREEAIDSLVSPQKIWVRLPPTTTTNLASLASLPPLPLRMKVLRITIRR